jgi:hypothetical protein
MWETGVGKLKVRIRRPWPRFRRIDGSNPVDSKEPYLYVSTLENRGNVLCAPPRGGMSKHQGLGECGAWNHDRKGERGRITYMCICICIGIRMYGSPKKILME